jgi:hypothetical protein
MTGLSQLLLISAVLLWVVWISVVRCRRYRHAAIPWLEILTDWHTFKAKDWVALALLLVLTLIILSP